MGNYIGIDEAPKDMYGKAMSIPDELMMRYFMLVTDMSIEDQDDMEERLENVQATLKEIEDDQVSVSERLVQIEKDDVNARQKANVYVNRLHTIKRYMEKRNLPGIPQKILETIL